MTEQAPGLLGSAALVPDDGSTWLHNQRIGLVIPDKEKADRDFICHLLNSPDVRNQINATATGTKVRHTAPKRIEAVTVPLPPIRDQRRIAAVLSAIDGLTEVNKRRTQLLEDLARSLYREWFVSFRFPGSGDSRLVDSEMGMIPEDWAVQRVGDLVSTLSRGVSPKYSDDGNWVVVNQRCIRNRRVDLTVARRHEGKVPDAKRIQAGDVLINSTGVGTLGRVAVFMEEQPGITVDSHVTVARVEPSAMHSWFGLSMLDREPLFEAMGTGSTGQTELRRAAVGGLPILVPPQLMLAEFDELIRPLLQLIPDLHRVQRELAKSRELLLPRLVTGQLDISDVDLGVLTPPDSE